MFFSTRTKLKNLENQNDYSVLVLLLSCDDRVIETAQKVICAHSQSNSFNSQLEICFMSVWCSRLLPRCSWTISTIAAFYLKKMANFVSYYTHFLSNFTIQWHIQMKKSSKTVDVLLGTNCCHQDANSQPKVQSRKRYHSAIQATHLQPFSYLPLESPELSQKHSTLLFATE